MAGSFGGGPEYTGFDGHVTIQTPLIGGGAGAGRFPGVSRLAQTWAWLVVLLEFVLCMVSMAGWMRPSVCQDSGASAEKSVRLGASHWEITESLLSPHGDCKRFP